jgi:hypothetical protein
MESILNLAAALQHSDPGISLHETFSKKMKRSLKINH